MKNYEIIVDSNAYTVEKIAEQKLIEGFILVGGVSMAISRDGTIWFAQAVAEVASDQRTK